jgi:hypothetical protein
MPTEYWRWGIVSIPMRKQNVGAFCFAGFNHNVFFRPSVIAENRIIPPWGKLADSKIRDLPYFITHEIGHAIIFDRIGSIANFTDLPKWLQEGYPDYIAKKSFDFESNLKQFKNNEWRLTEKSGLYVQYHLFVSLLIDKKGYTLEELLKKPPAKVDVINMLESYSEKK